jgi:hypothetical protein
MKKIRVKNPPPDPANPIVLIGRLTLVPGQETLVFEEKILESPEVKKALQEGKIEIIEDD